MTPALTKPNHQWFIGLRPHFAESFPVYVFRAMKNFTHLSKTSSRVLCCVLLAGAVTGGAFAAENTSQSRSASSSRSQSQRSSQSSIEQIKITRASNFLGTDVMSSDGHKVGDISDFYYDAAGTPHLKYVIIESGGILGIGGDTRAVPAQALSSEGDTVKIDSSRDEFWGVPVLPQNQSRFLKDPQNQDRIAQAFQGQSTSTRTQSRQSSQQSSQQNLISFSQLRNAEITDKDGERLGQVVDTWVSLNLNRAPYFEVSAPPDSPFAVLPRNRYAIPMSELEIPSDAGGDYRVSMSSENIRDSETVSEAEGVKLLESGIVGQQVLRVTVSEGAAE